jgi:hypothetical protein
MGSALDPAAGGKALISQVAQNEPTASYRLAVIDAKWLERGAIIALFWPEKCSILTVQ